MQWLIDDIVVLVERRSVRALRLTVYPDGKVKLVVPTLTSDASAKDFLLERRDWLKSMLQRVNEYRANNQQKDDEVVLFGKIFHLRTEFVSSLGGVVKGVDEIVIYCKKSATAEQKKNMIKQFLRNELFKYLAVVVEKYRVQFSEASVTWKIRDMKTEWGSCIARKRSLLFNLQLAHKNYSEIDYVVVHELCHLQVQNHGPLFKSLMNQRMSDWRERKKKLNNK